MATKFTIAAAAAFTLCGVATANAAALKAPAGTDTVCQVPYVENFNDASKVLNHKTLAITRAGPYSAKAVTPSGLRCAQTPPSNPPATVCIW